MQQANKALWSALKRVARPEKPLDMLAAVWPVVLGPRLAAHTRPVAWNKGCVTIEASEPEWQKHVQDMTAEVRRQINRWWGTELVVEVRLAPVKRAKTPAKPQVAGAGTSSPAESPARVMAESKLRAAVAELEPSLRGIADDELRDLITRVAAKYLAGKEKK